MTTVGFVLHPERPLAGELAGDAVGWLEERGHAGRLLPHDAAGIGRPDLAVSEEAFTSGLDLVLSLGGDGTMLRVVDLCADAGVPVLGVNVGQLGYLSAIEPPELLSSLERFVAGRYTLEERMRIAVHVDAPTNSELPVVAHALNEVVVEKMPLGHTVRLRATLDGRYFTTYAADGLIVATPTGSTAYAFSARGPIVEPRHEVMLLTPVSPHMLFDRTLVLDPDTVVSLEVEGPRPAALSVDGRMLGVLDAGDTVRCSSDAPPAHFVTFGDRDFHQILKTKFGLNDR